MKNNDEETKLILANETELDSGQVFKNTIPVDYFSLLQKANQQERVAFMLLCCLINTKN